MEPFAGGLAVLLAGAALLTFAVVGFFDLWPESAHVAELRQAPHVVQVEAPVRPWLTRRRLVHVLDWHLVPNELHEGPAPYTKHLADVRAVQEEQRELLRHLATWYGLRAVYLEGLTTDTVPAYKERAALVADMERKEVPELLAQLDRVRAMKTDESRKIERGVRALLDDHAERLLSLGAPGRLLMDGEIAEVRPLDDAGPLAAADPRKADAATLRAREDVMVRNALAGGEPVVVVVLGGGHDLTESVRAADPGCGYVRVTTKKVKELMDGR